MKKLFNTAIPVALLHPWLLLLRICLGGFMFTHGLPKLDKLLAGETQFRDVFGLGEGPSLALAVFAEFFCSLLIMLGLGTRIAAVFLATTMLIAAFVVHASDPFGRKELALLYLLFYLTLIILGSGRFSLDHLLFGRSSNNRL